MKRTLIGFSRVNSTKSQISSSFNPLMTTQLTCMQKLSEHQKYHSFFCNQTEMKKNLSIYTFTGLYPSSMAVSIDFITLSCPLRLVRNSNFAGTSVSKLIFIKSSPHSLSFGSLLARVIPLVVIARDSSALLS